MSRSEHRTLDEFAPAAEAEAQADTEPRRTFEGAKYRGTDREPDTEAPVERGVCEACGAEVGAEFARVLGDNDGRIHACPECSESWSDLRYEANGREHPVYGVDWEVFDR
jgi:hypothetical protein